MKGVALFAMSAPLGANAHYIFNRLIVNGAAIGGEHAYTRKNTNSYMPSFPQEMVNSPDLRCNKGAKAGGTATYNAKAGDKLGFKIFNSEKIEHPGPGFVYVSKAPDKVADYDGFGDWMKVMESSLIKPNQPGVDTAWDSWLKDDFVFLVDHLAEHAYW